MRAIAPGRGTVRPIWRFDVDIATIKSKSIGELHEMAEGLNISNQLIAMGLGKPYGRNGEISMWIGPAQPPLV